MTASYLLFELKERLFGVKLTGALEIVAWRRTRRVPLGYPHVEGLLDYRGVLYPVFDLPRLLGIANQDPIGFTAAAAADGKRTSSIILLREEGNAFGITVDAVVKMAQYDDAPGDAAAVKGIDPRLVSAVRYEEDREIILLNFERLFHGG